MEENVQIEFRKKFIDAAKKRDSHLILAVDDIGWRNVERVVREASRELLAMKVHVEHPALWGMTHKEAIDRLKKLTNNAFVILDAKLADIDSTNAFKTRYYFEQGYDAIICHGFPGEKAVKAVVDVANEFGRGVFMLVAMSSEGHLFRETEVDQLVEIAHNVGVAGVIAPGNQYELTAHIRLRAKELLILSPGIGAQGGELDKAVGAGTDFAIVGRAILNAASPAEEAKKLKEQTNAALALRKQAKGKIILDDKLVSIFIDKEVLRFGDFTLKSGRKSAYFFNTGNLDSGKAMTRVGAAYADAIVANNMQDSFDVIFGPAYKGIPLAACCAQALYRKHEIEKRFVYDRKEAKTHGDAKDKLFVGNLKHGDRILIIDDVITTGQAKLEAIGKLTELGLNTKVTGMIILFNRQETDLEGKNPVEEFEKSGIKVVSVLNAHDLFEYLRNREIGGKVVVDDKTFNLFKQHQKEYGVKA